MKYKNYAFFLLLVFNLFCHSQNSLVVNYNYYQNGNKEQWKLVSSKEGSLYSNINAATKVKQSETENLEKLVKISVKSEKYFLSKLENSEVYTDYNAIDPENSLQVKLNYVLPIEDWNITNDTKIVGDNIVRKAEITIFCRTYNVWYSESIQSFYGPLLFSGLPGLVFEVSSQDGFIQIDLVDYTVKNDEYLSGIISEYRKKLDNIDKTSTETELDTAYKNFFLRLENKIIASMPRGVKISGGKITKGSFYNCKI